MANVTYVLIGIYSFLTGIAGIKQWKDLGFHLRALLFVLVSIGIIVILFIPNEDLQFVLLILAFVLLHILTVIQGIVTNGRITYSHHVSRFIFHTIIILIFYKFIK